MRLAGYTLTELLIALLILSILATFAFPGMQSLVTTRIADTERDQVMSLLTTARTAAIQFNQAITVCPFRERRCQRRDQWHRGAAAFMDRNGNRVQDPEEQIIALLPHLSSRIRWRAFRNRSYLVFTSKGYTDWQNGHFIFCPADGDARLARQLVLNYTGRIYYSRDSNNDGYHEDVRGRALTC